MITMNNPSFEGGVESVIKNLCTYLSNKGHKVTIICRDRNSYVMNTDYGKIISLSKKYSMYNDLLYNLHAAFFINRGNFDVIHAHGPCGFGESFLHRFRNRTTFCMTFHGTYAGLTKQVPMRLIGKMYSQIPTFLELVGAKGCDVCFACSRNVKTELIKYYGVSPNKIRVINNGVDTNKFRLMNKLECRRKLGLSENTIYALWVGRDKIRKGLDISIESIKRTENVVKQMIQLIVVGSGVKSDKNTLGMGKVDDSLLPLIYNASDFLIFPSRYEGNPVTVLEALACGLPVIVSKNSGVIVENGREGYVIGTFTINDYVKKICHLLLNSSLSGKMSINARETAEKYSWDNQGAKYLRAYNEVIN